MCFDAHNMPFKDNTISNIIMIDVLHHLSNPIEFFKEAIRVLEKNGKIIILEPFPSPFSLLIYRKFHPEPFIMDVDYFNNDVIKKKDSWESNQAISYLLFFKHKKRFIEYFCEKLNILKRKKMSCILYPA